MKKVIVVTLMFCFVSLFGDSYYSDIGSNTYQDSGLYLYRTSSTTVGALADTKHNASFASGGYDVSLTVNGNTYTEWNQYYADVEIELPGTGTPYYSASSKHKSYDSQYGNTEINLSVAGYIDQW